MIVTTRTKIESVGSRPRLHNSERSEQRLNKPRIKVTRKIRSILNPYPAWRKAYEWETPGQLEPQLTQPIEPKIHVLTEDHNHSMCRNAVFGDRAITLEQASDPDNGMYFDCTDCYVKLREGSGEDLV